MFEKIGYFKEYYINNRFIGTVTPCEKDRDEVGYYSRKDEVLTDTVILDNKKRIKKGTLGVHTLIYPLFGKLIK
jgi:hypothetical protein